MRQILWFLCMLLLLERAVAYHHRHSSHSNNNKHHSKHHHSHHNKINRLEARNGDHTELLQRSESRSASKEDLEVAKIAREQAEEAAREAARQVLAESHRHGHKSKHKRSSSAFVEIRSGDDDDEGDDDTKVDGSSTDDNEEASIIDSESSGSNDDEDAGEESSESSNDDDDDDDDSSTSAGSSTAQENQQNFLRITTGRGPTPTHDQHGPLDEYGYEMDPDDAKLANSYDEVKTQLLQKGKEIRSEAEWIQQVEEIMTNYRTKIRNVHGHIDVEKEELKGLLRKKRQIQNLRVQHNLEKQLKVAQSSLRELDDRLDVVQKKGDEFNSNKAKLTDAISNIKEHLTVLQKDPSVNYTSPVKTKYDIASVDTRGAGAAHGLPPMPPGAPPPPPPGAPPPGPPPGPPPPPVALELHGMADLI